MSLGKKTALLAFVVIAGFIVGNQGIKWAFRYGSSTETDAKTASTSPRIDHARRAASDFRQVRAQPTSAQRDDAIPLGAIPDQSWVTFESDEAMRRFLASIEGTGIRVLGSIDRLRTLRLEAPDRDALNSLLDGSERIGFIFPAYIPGMGSVQEGAVGFGSHFLSYLGIDGDRSGWGAGIKVAVLDSGVGADSLFGNPVRSVNFVDLPADSSTINSHGTAVAYLIAGEGGLAPDADILDFRIARDDGSSDTFLIAQAVLAAVDAGANVINLSLGSLQRNPLLEEALRAARDAGVVVFASAGNNGIDQILYPASSAYAVGVGAIDGRGEHLDFSNTGELAITAPGLALTAANHNGEAISFSGTSASAPMLSGAIAVVMSQMKLSAGQAWDLILANANDAGAPGPDPVYGFGTLDVGRVLRSSSPGISDLAVTANHLTVNASGYPIVQVVVQNQGTVTSINAPLTVQMPSGTHQLNVSSLAPGQISSFDLPLGIFREGDRINSVVTASGDIIDQNPANNRRVDVIGSTDGVTPR